VVLIGKVQGVGSSAPHGTTLDAKQPSTPYWINLARYAKGQLVNEAYNLDSVPTRSIQIQQNCVVQSLQLKASRMESRHRQDDNARMIPFALLLSSLYRITDVLLRKGNPRRHKFRAWIAFFRVVPFPNGYL
jgi:hypothetical protein